MKQPNKVWGGWPGLCPDTDLHLKHFLIWKMQLLLKVLYLCENIAGPHWAGLSCGRWGPPFAHIGGWFQRSFSVVKWLGLCGHVLWSCALLLVWLWHCCEQTVLDFVFTQQVCWTSLAFPALSHGQCWALCMDSYVCFLPSSWLHLVTIGCYVCFVFWRQNFLILKYLVL